MLLRAETRQIFVDTGYMSKACGKLKNDNRDDEFLVSRILFLTTYNTNIDIAKLIDEDKLAENVCLNISRHGKQCSMKQKKPKDPMEDMALIESLKLLFNLTHFCPDRLAAFSSCLKTILSIVAELPISSTKPLDQPVASLVNALMNLDLEDKDNIAILFPKSSQTIYLDCFVEILDKATKVYGNAELEQLVSPLLTLLRKLYEVGPNEIKTQMRKVILPSEIDRQQPLGRTETLASRLLRQSTDPATPQLRESISGLLFDMSDKDARSFVQNVGYGFASGFLFQHNVPIPENALEAWSTSGSERVSHESRNLDGRVNPITGQFLDMEDKVDTKEMTNEEKEREAERLFVLFERYAWRFAGNLRICANLNRLKKTGIVDIENPVAKAYQEGRFEELPDDADSD